MRITNSEYTPIELVAELIAPRGIKNKDTVLYFSEERSKHDWLVRTLLEKIDAVLESFKRYYTQVSETQCIRDNGVDVRLCYANANGDSRRIGFQVKSNMEADRDNNRPKERETLIATLKRQAFEAEQNARVDEWWIFSCFNMEIHQRLVSTINAEIGTGKPKGLKIRHVTPREAMAFLSMDDEEIDAICTLLLCKDDEVLAMAREEIRKLDDASQILVWNTLGPALEGDREFTLDDLFSFEDSDDSASAIEYLESYQYFSTSDGNRFIVEPSNFIGLCALYFEARARHGYSPSSANAFIQRMTNR